jgi:hypothetical protein
MLPPQTTQHSLLSESLLIQLSLGFSFQALAGDILERFGWTVSIKVARSRLLNAKENLVPA